MKEKSIPPIDKDKFFGIHRAKGIREGKRKKLEPLIEIPPILADSLLSEIKNFLDRVKEHLVKVRPKSSYGDLIFSDDDCRFFRSAFEDFNKASELIMQLSKSMNTLILFTLYDEILPTASILYNVKLPLASRLYNVNEDQENETYFSVYLVYGTHSFGFKFLINPDEFREEIRERLLESLRHSNQRF